MKRAIVIMAKVPVAGAVKTRLQSILPSEKCAALARAFLQDAIKKAQSVCKNIILAYSPAGQGRVLENMISPEIVLIEQTGANLGERMANAFEAAFRENSSVVLIGTDSPTFPAGYAARAFEYLEIDADIVLGKSTDGGFYLIGLRRPVSGLFDRIQWGSPQVFGQITSNIESAEIELRLLPEHYDVDTPGDLLMMKNEILADKNLQKLAEKTYLWLAENGETI